MQRDLNSRTDERGAAVLLFVALVVAAAIAATASMMVGRPQFAVQQATNTGFDMTSARKAVEAHSLVVDIVRCVGTDANFSVTGTITSCDIPWQRIGLPKRFATDPWGGTIRLIHHSTADATLNLTTQQAGEQTDCDFVLMSGGANRANEFAVNSSAIVVPTPANVADTDIAVCGEFDSGEGGGLPEDEDETPPPSADETTVFEAPPTSYVMTNDTNKNIKPRFKDSPHADWAVGDEVLYIGGSSDDPGTYDLTPGNVEKTSCTWFEEPFDFTDQTLRGFIRFQFLPGETDATETRNTGQGFALMVIPGGRVVSPTTCGDASVNNSYGFKGIPRPKFALEFDIFRDSYEGADDYTGQRNNPRPEGNHVALLNPSSADHISHGGAENPPCHTWGAYGIGPALNGSVGACTYPPGDPGYYLSGQAEPRPARHAVRPAHWLEDGRYFDTALNQTAAQPYAVRFEFRRLCNNDCSVCGVSGTKVHAKAWVSCDGSVTTENLVSDCPTISTAFQDTDAPYDGITDYMVNYCMPDRGLEFDQSFDTVKVGIGFSTLDSAVGLLLHRFEVKSE